MKVTIERAQLLKSLGHVQSVVERRNTIPILANVLIDAKDGRLQLTATDMDLALAEAVECAVAQGGATTAPAHTLYDIARKLPEGAQVELATKPGATAVTVRSGRSTFTLQALPESDFPATSKDKLPHTFTLAADSLKALIDHTRFAISTEETRYYLNGIYLHAATEDGGLLRAVATDGHRLARFQVPLPKGAGNIPGVIVPRKAVNELRKLLDETTGTVEVGLSETKIRFAFDDVTLTSKLIDGTFPDYERVIPTGNDKVMEVACKAFSDAVDRVSTISTEKSRAVKMALAKGMITLSATSLEQGSATEELEVSFGASPMEIGFNARYLLDITSQIEGDNVQFAFADAASPTLVRDGEDANALYVLMPMRV
ncbi:MAG: DNA polymerase III subunit beta [Gemmatimonas sp.]